MNDQSEQAFSNQPRRRGMTLIEVLLGTAILAIMAVAVVTALYYPRWLVVSSAHKQMAVHAAGEALEQALVDGYDSLTDGTHSLTLSDSYNMNGRSPDGELEVETLGGSGTPEYKHITVTVNYPNGDTPVVLETYISEAE
jgi:prepilin-type N-terminal cleavage/methylation domain-containing protein